MPELSAVSAQWTLKGTPIADYARRSDAQASVLR